MSVLHNKRGVRFDVDEGVQIDSIEAMSWSRLQSDTFGYHLCKLLARPSERATTWASADDEVVKAYRVPISHSNKVSEAENAGGSLALWESLATLSPHI